MLGLGDQDDKARSVFVAFCCPELIPRADAVNIYMVQEFLAVLLLLATSTATILGFAVALVLFQERIRRAVPWAKTSVVRRPNFSPKDQWVRRTES
jgi:hypothetical protein